jgi:hypothetical protein
MVTADNAQQWRELRETYGQMTEEELCRVAEDAFELTQIAREALRSVIAEKGLKIRLAEAPPREEAEVPVGDSTDELDLTTLCQLKSEADARRAKAILNTKFIPSCLGPENIADLENFKGSFAGGVDLKVFSEHALRARRLLYQYAPDLMDLEDLPEDEDELDYAITCPKCQSQDIILEGTDAPPDDASREDKRFWDKARWTCAACGHQWQDEGIAHIVNNDTGGQSNSSA